jgi:hypothetical protein
MNCMVVATNDDKEQITFFLRFLVSYFHSSTSIDLDIESRGPKLGFLLSSR